MKCTSCGYEFPKGKFCPVCGTPAPISTDAQSRLGDFSASYASAETYTYDKPEPTYKPEVPVAPVMPAKRKLSGAVIAIILALVLVAGVVAGILLLGKGPADKIGKGLKKTLDSEIFNFEVTVDIDGETMNFAGTIEIIPEDYVLNMYMDATYTGADETITFGIYDGQAFSIEEDDGEKWYSYSEIDEDAMEEFFDYYLEYGDSDLNKKKDVLRILEEIDDLSDGELSEIVDLEVLAKCITEYVGAHNDKKWLEENAGFSQEKKDGVTYYIYEPDLYDFCEGSLPFFEEALDEEDYYDDAMDAIDDSRSELKSLNLEISFGVKSGYLTSILIEGEGAEIEVTFSDFGKAELDHDELDDLASECEKGYEEQREDYYGYYD